MKANYLLCQNLQSAMVKKNPCPTGSVKGQGWVWDDSIKKVCIQAASYIQIVYIWMTLKKGWQ